MRCSGRDSTTVLRFGRAISVAPAKIIGHKKGRKKQIGRDIGVFAAPPSQVARLSATQDCRFEKLSAARDYPPTHFERLSARFSREIIRQRDRALSRVYLFVAIFAGSYFIRRNLRCVK